MEVRRSQAVALATKEMPRGALLAGASAEGPIEPLREEFGVSPSDFREIANALSNSSGVPVDRLHNRCIQIFARNTNAVKLSDNLVGD